MTQTTAGLLACIVHVIACVHPRPSSF